MTPTAASTNYHYLQVWLQRGPARKRLRLLLSRRKILGVMGVKGASPGGHQGLIGARRYADIGIEYDNPGFSSQTDY